MCYAGISYAEGYVRKGHLRPKLPGIADGACTGVHILITLPSENILLTFHKTGVFETNQKIFHPEKLLRLII